MIMMTLPYAKPVLKFTPAAIAITITKSAQKDGPNLDLPRGL